MIVDVVYVHYLLKEGEKRCAHRTKEEKRTGTARNAVIKLAVSVKSKRGGEARVWRWKLKGVTTDPLRS